MHLCRCGCDERHADLWLVLHQCQRQSARVDGRGVSLQFSHAPHAAGPFAGEVPPERIRPGDIVQLSFDGAGWQHSPVVVAANRPRSYADILVAAHSFDADDRPLSTYEFVRARFLHIGGVYRQG